MKNLLTNIDRQLIILEKFGRRNKPAILTALGTIGFGTSIVMAAKATPEALRRLEVAKKDIPEDATKAQIVWIETKAVAPAYAKTAVTAIASAVCVIEAQSENTRRIAAVTTGYELLDQSFKEYKSQVVETIGEKKEQAIRDEIAKEHAAKSEIKEDDIIQVSTGSTLFMDSVSGRYFRSTKDDIYRALREFDRWLLLENYEVINDWYQRIGLDPIPSGDKIGFNSTDGIDIYFSVQEAPNGEPVTVIEYRTPPTYDFSTIGRW